VQTPEPAPPENPFVSGPGPEPRLRPLPGSGLWAAGETLTWVSGLLLSVSAFTDWYAGSQGDGLTLAVTGWHTGALGKLVFFCGLAALILEALREAGIELPATVPESLVLLLVILREFGIELPATVPESLVVIALGSLATIFVLIRLISIPDTFFGTAGRGIGLAISLLSALALIAAGLLRAGEEL
jgi:hypothetical protein